MEAQDRQQGRDEQAEWYQIYCACCRKVTSHMDLWPLPVGYKCTRCGEYNREGEYRDD